VGWQQVRVVLRALALLQLAKGASAPRISSVVPLTPQAIRKVGHRYQAGGLESALYDKQRPGATGVLDDSQKQRIIAMVCSAPPEGRARWAVRLVAQEAVKRRLVPAWEGKPFGFCSSTTTSSRGGKKMWCVAELNDAYIAKMEDVLETYEKPTTPRSRWYVWTRSPSRCTRTCVPLLGPSRGGKRGGISEYERRGTANVFCAVEPKAGRHFIFPTPNRSAFEFARVACHLAMQYPEADTIHLVMDNLNIHCRKSLTDAFGAEVGNEIWDRFTVHFTPPTEAGSIRRKSKSASTRGNASVPEESPTLRRYAGKAGLGTAK